MSFREKLSKFWNNVQTNLFPTLEADLGNLSPDHKKLISVLELVRIEDFIPCTKFKNGRPPKQRKAIARANIAKIIFKFDYTSQLVKYLKVDKQFSSICGFDPYKNIPTESTFSRAFKEFADASLPEKVHQFLVKNVYKDQIIGHTAIDSTPLVAREKHLKKGSCKNRNKLKADKKKARKAGELNRREKQLKETDINKMEQDLPNQCDKGMKKNSQGYTKIWKGYKIHAAVDDHCIPLAVMVTSASVNDCEVAIPLMLKANQVAQSFYFLMDAAYDHPEIKVCSTRLGSVSIIDQCPGSSKAKKEKEAEKGRRKLLNVQAAEDKRYKERFPKERFNAAYKDFNGGGNMFYKGYSKVFCHVMFGALTFAAATIISLVQ